MSSQSPTALRDARAGDHVVQFHGSDEHALARSVGRYLCEGLERGDGVLIIATPDHRDGFFAEMTAAGHDPVRAVCERRLVLFDSDRTLARFMVAGEPDPDRFRAVLQAALERALAPSGRLRLYGDMVGLLWEAGQQAAAVRLEGLWNDAQRQGRFDLFCAYPIDVFSSAFQMAAVDGVLCTHSALMPTGAGVEMERCVERAMDDVLGPRVHALRLLIKANFRPSWATLPNAEAIILWVRNNLPDHADAILSRARGYYQQAIVC